MTYAEKHSNRSRIQLVSATAFILLLVLGWIYPLLGYFAVLCMMAGVGIGFVRGRKWCDFCPRGSFYDKLGTVSRKRSIPHFFKGWTFRIAVILFMMTVMTLQITKRWPDPSAIGAFFIFFLTVTTVVGVILGILVHPRTFCYFCPVGTMANVAGRGKNTLTIDSSKCTECKLCAGVCPMQLKPYTHKGEGIRVVNEPDCIKCGLCVERCPTRVLTFKT
jgi:polyferredoxin